MSYTVDPKVRQALDIIDRLLSGDYLTVGTALSLNTVQTTELASILSAMRGPDFEDSTDLKWATTSVIRKVAFPKAADLFGSVNAAKVIEWSDMEEGADGAGSLHFDGHIRLAARALRIPILDGSGRDEVNDHEDDEYTHGHHRA